MKIIQSSYKNYFMENMDSLYYINISTHVPSAFSTFESNTRLLCSDPISVIYLISRAHAVLFGLGLV